MLQLLLLLLLDYTS